MQDIQGWLLVYAVGSLPVLFFYSAGLAGWVYDYPIPLLLSIFIAFLAPVVLLLLRMPSAPQWNIALVWSGAALLTSRIIHGIVQGDIPIERNAATMLVSFVAFAIAWAGVWTAYFLKSERVARVFG